MRKIFFLILLLILLMGNVSANEDNKFYDYGAQFFNNFMYKSTKESLNLNFKSFDFLCYNSCKERNEETFCRQQCSLK